MMRARPGDAWLHALLAACGGFLVATLWFDLMFDVQALGHPGELPEEVRLSIARYYRRVTTEAHPMQRVIVAAMAVAVLGTGWTMRHGSSRLLHLLALVTAWGPIVLAAVRVVPNAARLGALADPPAVQSALARAVLADHVGCLAAMLVFTATQVVLAGACQGARAS